MLWLNIGHSKRRLAHMLQAGGWVGAHAAGGWVGGRTCGRVHIMHVWWGEGGCTHAMLLVRVALILQVGGCFIYAHMQLVCVGGGEGGACDSWTGNRSVHTQREGLRAEKAQHSCAWL